MNSYRRYFRLRFDQLQKWRTLTVRRSKPIKQRHFSVSPAIEKLLYAEIDRMLALVVIKESQSTWPPLANLMVKSSKVCVCLDLDKVNNIVVKNAYSLHLIEEFLCRFPKAWCVLANFTEWKPSYRAPGWPFYQFVITSFESRNVSLVFAQSQKPYQGFHVSLFKGQ